MVKRKPIRHTIVLSLLLISLNIQVKSLPINSIDKYDLTDRISEIEITTGDVTDDIVDDATTEEVDYKKFKSNATNDEEIIEFHTITNGTAGNGYALRSLRSDQLVRSYSVEITPNGDTFHGRAIIDIEITGGDLGFVTLHAENLNIHSITYGFFNLEPELTLENYNTDDGVLEMEPEESPSYVFLIEYEGVIRNDGRGLYRGTYDDSSYLAMNLHPTYARRVFPCADLSTASPPISLIFNNDEHNNIVANTMNDGNSELAEFSPLEAPPSLLGLVAHNFQNILSPGDRLRFYARPGLGGQDAYASVVTQSIVNFLEEYTDKPHSEIYAVQDPLLHIFAMPDITRKWHSLSTIGIWEPYMLMETIHSMKQQKTALMAMAEAYATQWFGYVIYPQNWRFAWFVEGFGRYAAYEAALEADTRLDMAQIFVSDVIQESLFRDGYESSHALEPDNNFDEEPDIRDHVNGLIKYKAPALMHLLKLILGEDENYVQLGARTLVNGRALSPVVSQNFYAAMNSRWLSAPNKLIDNIEEYLEPWVKSNGYPVLHVQLRSGSNGVFLTQERFGFTGRDNVNYDIPYTYTTSLDLDFDNIYPATTIDRQPSLNVFIPEEEWIIFNLQGQGYYRVNYDDELWERLIEALSDPERRADIHPLNRATLIDDALNLARAGMLSYEIAFQVVLTMELETEYVVWKAFVRNMDFLRKRLVAYVTDEEDLDPDIYLRMVRRTIHAVENELGFQPEFNILEEESVSLTRGLVMDHACRANYAPCIAAAIDLFYDPNSGDPTVNPQIAHDIRPAVYCTMVREGDEDVIEALWQRYEEEPSHYERVVIIESLACSRNEDYIWELLQETITDGGRFPTTEKSKFLMAVMESSYENARIALNFFRANVNAIRDMYGGNEVLEEMLYVLAENMADFDLTDSFRIWVNQQDNQMDDNQAIANRAVGNAAENLHWDDTLREFVYDWINENDAAGLSASIALCLFPILITIFNQ